MLAVVDLPCLVSLSMNDRNKISTALLQEVFARFESNKLTFLTNLFLSERMYLNKRTRTVATKRDASKSDWEAPQAAFEALETTAGLSAGLVSQVTLGLLAFPSVVVDWSHNDIIIFILGTKQKYGSLSLISSLWCRRSLIILFRDRQGSEPWCQPSVVIIDSTMQLSTPFGARARNSCISSSPRQRWTFRVALDGNDAGLQGKAREALTESKALKS